VAASRIPVVTGVGHEIDFTLVDFAADHRAPTPSAAAEVVTPDGDILRTELRDRSARLDAAIDAQISTRRADMDDQGRWLARLSPEHAIQTARQRVDDLLARGDRRLHETLRRQRDQLAAQVRALDAASPAALLARGYAIVTRTGDGKRITSAHDAAEGTTVQIDLYDGRLTARINARELDGTS
ncbi:MAG: exodeoxyribonuclease VII large subunit, partial [Anaerolineae bacterium]|nr:exodeoxyribonuclease VII large subunit [Anaerolineae bacterium]